MKIHYISPFSRQKNIGLAINQAIKDLRTNDDDWIALNDMDTLWLLPESKAVLEQILETTDFDILGAVTNRLAMPTQVIPGIADDWNIINHIGYARKILEANGTNVREVGDILAAFCLCFRVKVWQNIPFKENSIQFDSMFCLDAMRHKYKLGIMEGIYLFHLYRPLSDNPAYDYHHLLPPK